MRFRFWLILILIVSLEKASVRCEALSSAGPDSLGNILNILKCEGWADKAAAQQLSTCGQSSPTLPNASISDDLLQEYRCRDKEQRTFQRGQRKIIIDAYQFATPDGAYGAYCAARRGSSSYLAQGDASSEDQNSISFYKNKYFVYLRSTEADDDEAKTAIAKLSHQLIEQIDSADSLEKIRRGDNTQPAAINNGRLLTYTGKPAIFNSMPNLERVHGSEKLVMGPVSLKRFFNAPYIAALGSLLEGAVADYKIEEPHRDRLKLLIACYATVQQASMTYASYISTLASQNDEKSAEGFSGTAALFKISDSYMLCQLHDKKIVVIKGARHKDTLSELAHQLY